MSRRKYVDDRLDRFRFLLDRWRLDYQPLPFLGIDEAPRSEGVQSRWQPMASIIDECGGETAVDIGCNAGYYVISLAQRGVATVGIESDQRYVRLLVHASKRLGLDHVGVTAMHLSPSTVALVPQTDITLLLAVWHHLVRAYGLEQANSVVSRLWQGTRRVLFFETGEAEMPASYGLPEMTPDPATYLEGFLQDHCPGGRVVHLGVHAASDPRQVPCKRNLFAVVRPDA